MFSICEQIFFNRTAVKLEQLMKSLECALFLRQNWKLNHRLLFDAGSFYKNGFENETLMSWLSPKIYITTGEVAVDVHNHLANTHHPWIVTKEASSQ